MLRCRPTSWLRSLRQGGLETRPYMNLALDEAHYRGRFN
jgi:hypothetical protein